jgi:hypothetical protein
MSELKLGKITQYDRDMLKLTLRDNPYIPDKIKKGVLGYPQQLKTLIYLNRPIINDYWRLLIGGKAFGGKTLFLAVLALRYMHIKGWKGLATRKNYDDLTAEDVDSVYGYICKWNDENQTNHKLKIKQHPPSIKSKEGCLLDFRAFDHISKKEKTRSKTYQGIYNDEGTELAKQIITFQGRSLRQDTESRFPKCIVHSGNPQFDPKTFTLNDTSQWFLNDYVEGQHVYVPMGWTTNPYINKDEYEASFEDMDEIDKQSQKYGNWKFKFQTGGLIDVSTLKNYLSPPLTNRSASILSIDLAGRGRDKYVISTLTLDLKTNQILFDNISQTVGLDTEALIEKHIIEDHSRRVYPSAVLLEIEPGSWIDTEKYYKNFFNQMGIIVYPKKPVGSKFNRARPMVREMKQGHVLINEMLKKKLYTEISPPRSYFELIQEELGMLAPVMPVSPNIIDSLSQGFNYLRKVKIKG